MFDPMILSKNAPYRDGGVKPTFLRRSLLARCCSPLAIAAFMSFAAVQPSGAASPSVALFADRDLGNAIAQAAQDAGANAAASIDVRPSASVAACASTPGTAPRLALLVNAPSRAELDRCAQATRAEVNIIEIGRQAVAFVAPMNSPVWSVDSAAVFRALGQNSGDAPKVTTWDQLDPAYPKLPIGLLLPPANSRTLQLFSALIMEPGCDRVATARTPFDQKARSTFCGALRNDIQVAQRKDGAQDVADWAATAPAGQVAVVSVAELLQLDRRVIPLLLDGVLPTAANIESGRYPAADKVQLMIVVPNAASRSQRTAARDVAFNLLAEASIGPTGSLAPAGLIPLPPTDRIAARTQAVALLEQH